MRRRSVLLLLTLLAALTAAPARAQGRPERPKNLKVLPEDISRQELIATMRGFALGLGVRCEYCHARDTTGEHELDFASDAKEEKQNARFMLRMVRYLNQERLPDMPHRGEPPVEIRCVTCHRGSPRPATIETVLAETIRSAGVDSAVALYRSLREDAMLGRYDFGDRPLQELARSLSGSNDAAARRMLELNLEFWPESEGTLLALGDVAAAGGDAERARGYWRRVLELDPENEQAKRRLEQQ